MSQTIIKVENLGKRYQIGAKQPYYSLRESIMDLFDFKKSKVSEDFWSLKDVNFEIKQGESVGIIGRNGAGKSTLLKILSQITPPTTGRVTMYGRVASLLEVGTGFNLELTGRENIFLNGAILGMSRQEIKRKFDVIVSFSEVEKFLDTPVKHYSSGMYMRLAFAVAAHLESEILIVDEVLAVGDSEFQKKCLGKMDEVAKKEGRTVLFVSHNMSAIKNFCNKSILLDGGRMVGIGDSDSIVSKYLDSVIVHSESSFKYDANKSFQLLKTYITDIKNRESVNFECDMSILIHFSFFINKKIKGLYGYLNILNENGEIVLESDSIESGRNNMDNLQIGEYDFCITIPSRTLSPGKYRIFLSFASIYGFEVDIPGIVNEFVLNDSITARGNNRKGYFSMLLNWNDTKI